MIVTSVVHIVSSSVSVSISGGYFLYLPSSSAHVLSRSFDSGLAPSRHFHCQNASLEFSPMHFINGGLCGFGGLESDKAESTRLACEGIHHNFDSFDISEFGKFLLQISFVQVSAQITNVNSFSAV